MKEPRVFEEIKEINLIEIKWIEITWIDLVRPKWMSNHCGNTLSASFFAPFPTLGSSLNCPVYIINGKCRNLKWQSHYFSTILLFGKVWCGQLFCVPSRLHQGSLSPVGRSFSIKMWFSSLSFSWQHPSKVRIALLR